MIKLPAFASLTLILLACAPFPALGWGPERDSSELSIWLSPYSPIEALDQIDAIWTRPFNEWEDYKEQQNRNLQFYKNEASGRKVSFADNCKAINDFEKQGYQFVRTLMSGPQKNMCDFLNRLRSAVPSKWSHLRNFEFTERSVDVLPTFFSYRFDCEMLCRYAEANRQKIPISQFWKLTNISSEDGSFLYFRDEINAEFHVHLLAKGDFNGDGLEDLFVNWNSHYTDMQFHIENENFILTRDQPGGILRVVDPESHLCGVESGAVYQCDQSHSDLSYWLDARH